MSGVSSSKRFALGVAVLAAVTGAGLLTAPSASAAVGQEQCAENDSVGAICVYETSSGYNAAFVSNTTDTVDFNLWIAGGAVGDQGAFKAVPGGSYTYFFNTGDSSVAHLCLYSRTGSFSPLCTPNLYN